MRTIEDILHEKQHAIERLRREIEALQSVTPLFADHAANAAQTFRQLSTSEAAKQLREALRTVAPLLVDDTDELDPRLRERLAQATEADFKELGSSRLKRHLKQIAAPLLRHSERDRRMSFLS